MGRLNILGGLVRNRVTDPQWSEVEVVMGEAAILEDALIKVMVVTKSAEVADKFEPLQHNIVGATGRQVIGRYAFPGRSEAETSDAVITGNLLVCDCMASVLFDLGSTFSYVSSSFSTGLDLHCDLFDMPICVSSPVGESVIVEKVYRS